MTDAQEINFDGLIGPSHNYGGLSLGNIASSTNQGGVARPKAAALQGLAKMRLVAGLGIRQGILPPQPRPDYRALHILGYRGTDSQMAARCWQDDPRLFANLFSASAMWAANAATISPSADTGDARLHVSPANLVSNLHRSREAAFTHRLLATLFADDRHFAVHPPLPMSPHLSDEGAANHGRLCQTHGAAGTQLFVYGDKAGGRFPARQALRAAQAIARRHQLAPAHTLFLQQANKAIEAGAFHNDVVSVANGTVLFAHEDTFEHREAAHAALRTSLPGLQIIEVTNAQVPLADAIKSYLFNSQLVTLPDNSMALILPAEVRENAAASRYLDMLLQMETPIKEAHVIDVRESMRNGGGPACLRLRVVVTAAELAALDPRFLLDDSRMAALEQVIEATYPDEIAASQLGDPQLHVQVQAATEAIYACLGLEELLHAPDPPVG